MILKTRSKFGKKISENLYKKHLHGNCRHEINASVKADTPNLALSTVLNLFYVF